MYLLTTVTGMSRYNFKSLSEYYFKSVLLRNIVVMEAVRTARKIKRVYCNDCNLLVFKLKRFQQCLYYTLQLQSDFTMQVFVSHGRTTQAFVSHNRKYFDFKLTNLSSWTLRAAIFGLRTSFPPGSKARKGRGGEQIEQLSLGHTTIHTALGLGLDRMDDSHDMTAVRLTNEREK